MIPVIIIIVIIYFVGYERIKHYCPGFIRPFLVIFRVVLSVFKCLYAVITFISVMFRKVMQYVTGDADDEVSLKRNRPVPQTNIEAQRQEQRGSEAKRKEQGNIEAMRPAEQKGEVRRYAQQGKHEAKRQQAGSGGKKTGHRRKRTSGKDMYTKKTKDLEAKNNKIMKVGQ